MPPAFHSEPLTLLSGPPWMEKEVAHSSWVT